MRVLPALGRDGDLLEREWVPREDIAVLEDRGPIAEDKVDGAGDGALAVELAEGVGVEGVLVALHAAPVEGGLVRVDAEGDALVALRAGGVAECYVTCDESLARDGCDREKLVFDH